MHAHIPGNDQDAKIVAREVDCLILMKQLA